MNEKEFVAHFQHAVLEKSIQDCQGNLCLPLPSKQWLILDSEQLTDVDTAYIEHYYHNLKQDKRIGQWEQHPWYRYLLLHSDSVAIDAKVIQFVHVRVYSHEQLDAVVSMLQSFFTPILACFKLSQEEAMLVLDQTVPSAIETDLNEMMSVIEFDFDTKWSVLIGQLWDTAEKTLLPTVCQAEHNLFQKWCIQHEKTACLTFVQLLLWNQRHAVIDTSILTKELLKKIHTHDQLDTIIHALWQESAVLTKVAQRLYMHRNTLQYKIDKFYEQTGISLKKMDDLALCYFILMK